MNDPSSQSTQDRPRAALDPSDQAEVEELLAQLIAISSINPWITPGAVAEGTVAAFIADWLGAVDGVQLTVDEVLPGRPNLLARIPGTAGGPHLCLNVHTDTVDCADWPEAGLSPRRVGDRIVGLGAADNKGQCAALMMLVKRLAAAPAPGDVTAIFAIDEEGPSAGSHHLVESFRADACIVLEPMGIGRACVMHQGFGSLDLVVRAEAAHGMADDSPDAIVQLADLVKGLAAIDRTLAANPHPEIGKAFFHTSFVRGGTDYGTYPSEVTLGFEFGTNPGETLADRLAEIDAVIAAVRLDHPTLDAQVVARLDNAPFTAEGHEALLAAFDGATTEVLGAGVETFGLNTWTDAAIMQAAGIPTIVCGADGGNCHAVDEWVRADSLGELVLVLDGACRRFGA
jgi:acetylornithine deacetylase/succinyl-diaminopimelate desuccinylase-like protein